MSPRGYHHCDEPGCTALIRNIDGHKRCRVHRASVDYEDDEMIKGLPYWDAEGNPRRIGDEPLLALAKELDSSIHIDGPEPLDVVRQVSKKLKDLHGANRAHRIDVDRCGACPFAWPSTGQTFYCQHPLVVDKDRLIVNPESPPEWCPLRGSLTMISGPVPIRCDGEHSMPPCGDKECWNREDHPHAGS